MIAFSRWGSTVCLAAVVAGTLPQAGPAYAQSSPTNKALADTLFREGRRLMGENKFAEACPKLAESLRMDPAGGTLLNLGVCHAEEGKLATAHGELSDAMAAAKRDRRPDREKVAQQYLAKLEPRLSRLTLVVPEAARVAELQLELDGTPLGGAAWGLATPIDPGEHEVRAAAAGKLPWSKRFSVGPTATKQTIEIPALESEPVRSSPVAASVSAPPQGGASTGTTAAAAASLPQARTGRRTASYVVGGAGLAALGVGGFFAWRAFSQWDERTKRCADTQTVCLDPTAQAYGHRADTAAVVADISVGVGIAALATAAYLWLTSRTTDGETQARHLGLTGLAFAPVGPRDTGGRLVLEGRF